MVIITSKEMQHLKKDYYRQDIVAFTISALIPGLYFLCFKRYRLCIYHILLFASLFWLSCLVILIFNAAFWKTMIACVFCYYVIGLFLWKKAFSKKGFKFSFLKMIYVNLLSISSLILPGIAYFFYRKNRKAIITLSLFLFLFAMIGQYPFLCFIIIIFNLYVATDVYLMFNGYNKIAYISRFFIFFIVGVLTMSLVLRVGCKRILDIRKVVSDCMSPVIKTGDYVLTNRFAFLSAQTQQKNIVLYVMPSNTGEYSNQAAIKRIAAVGGDKVYWQEGKMFVNGNLYKTSNPDSPEEIKNDQALSRRVYAKYDQSNPYIIPEGYMFLIGDNYNESYDSRYFGPLEHDAILGKVIQKIWPRKPYKL